MPCHRNTQRELRYGINFASYFARFLAFNMRPKSVLEFGGGLGMAACLQSCCPRFLFARWHHTSTLRMAQPSRVTAR
jgi:hypothetical protein